MNRNTNDTIPSSLANGNQLFTANSINVLQQQQQQQQQQMISCPPFNTSQQQQQSHLQQQQFQQQNAENLLGQWSNHFPQPQQSVHDSMFATVQQIRQQLAHINTAPQAVVQQQQQPQQNRVAPERRMPPPQAPISAADEVKAFASAWLRARSRLVVASPTNSHYASAAQLCSQWH